MIAQTVLQRLQAIMSQFGLHFSNPSRRQALVDRLASLYGVRVVEHTSNTSSRRWRLADLELLAELLSMLGPTFYGPFLSEPLHVAIDPSVGGGAYGNQWLWIGEPAGDLSVIYRIFIHEATHASNEYRGWPYETQYCMLPGFDWSKDDNTWTHPRQQGQPLQEGPWETLPVDTRAVSTSPAEDLAESVRYFVHSVRNEREWLWPLDHRKPPLYLWDTSPTRFIFVRDIFLNLPPTHPWFRLLDQATENRVRSVLNLPRKT